MRNAAIIFVIAFIYASSSLLGFSLAAPGTLVSPVWPPAGIALAAVLIYGNRALLGVFLGCFIANAHMFFSSGITLFSLWFMLLPAAGGALQAYVGKSALIKLTGATTIFQNTRSVLIFILITGFAACLINATFSTPLLVLVGKLPLVQLPYEWLTWWIADAVGVIAVASTILAWMADWKIKMEVGEGGRLIATWLAILIIGYFFIIHGDTNLTFIFIPFAIWAAFQFDIRISLLTGLLISGICLYDSAQTSYNPLNSFSINASISQMQVFIAIIYLTILLIHAILSDRKKAYDRLQLLNTQLEQLVLDRTSALLESNQQLEVQKNKAIDAFEALKKSHARLMQSEKMASLGMLTAGVAHEIKHPLNATSANMESIPKIMSSFGERLQETKMDTAMYQDYQKMSEEINALIAASHLGITRTSDVIADLCAFARSDEPEMVMTDLNRHIDSTLNLLSSEIRSNITIIKEYGNIPQVLTHPGKINQVLMNVLINAIHALQTRPNSRITLTTASNEDRVSIHIKDNGPGMAKEVLEKLFTPFMTTKAEGMGSGLGLFISNNIIKEHRGKIKVLSVLGEGTEFVITLPIQEG